MADAFEIHDADDKVADGDPSSFGYMSIHYLATLKDHHSGPGYDDLKGIKFEVQTRTIVMDAWANVFHYLDYKGESSIPVELRKDLFALSGLFYVADQHFEMFSERASESQERAEEEVLAERASISEFVEEISTVGFTDIEALAKALDEGEERFLQYEGLSSSLIWCGTALTGHG